MMNEAQVFLAGYVAREPKYRKTHNGYSYTSLRVGYTPRRVDRDSGEWSDGGTSFVTVFCWRGLADNVATCVRKGDPVVVKGKLQVRPYINKDGASRVAVEIEASSLGHDLARGVANFQRAHRAAGETALERAASEVQAGEPGAGEPGVGEVGAAVAGNGVPAAPPGGMFAEDAVAALAGPGLPDETDDDAGMGMPDDPDDGAGPAPGADAAEPGAEPAPAGAAAPF